MLRCTALIALALVPATPALAAPTTTATLDGYKFEYATEVADGGKVVLDGRLLDGPEKFTFVVEANGKVHGNVGGNPVEFEIGRKQHDRLISEIAEEATGTQVASGN